MKMITVYFEDEDMDKLKQKKGDKTWRDFILELAGVKESGE